MVKKVPHLLAIVRRAVRHPRKENLMNLQLRPPAGQKHKKASASAGHGLGRGKTGRAAPRAQRVGLRLSQMRGFEGGQMPLHRRLPKRGFTNIFKKEYAIVNLGRWRSWKATRSIRIAAGTGRHQEAGRRPEDSGHGRADAQDHGGRRTIVLEIGRWRRSKSRRRKRQGDRQ
jgi:hypothetical protein